MLSVSQPKNDAACFKRTEWMSVPTHSWILGLGVLLAYALVQGNAGNLFPHERANDPYFESPYWVGIPKHVAMAVTGLQLLASIGYFAWTQWAFDATVHAAALTDTFLVASLAWPFVAYMHVRSPQSLAWAIASCVPLVVAAFAVLGMIAAAFALRAPTVPTFGVLCLGVIVVLVDGVGWTAACLTETR